MADAPRVLSLLSASTEIIHRLGCSHLLVGRSHGCDDPPLAQTLPVATAPRVDPNAPSKEIDTTVRAQAAAGGPIYHVHSDFVKAAKPDVIITQEQCRICAVTPEDVEAVCQALPAAMLVTIKPTTLDDVFGDVETIARALGVPERGDRLVAMLRARLDALQKISSSVAASTPPPRVAHVEWLSPLMGSGYWISELFGHASCTMVHGTRGGHSTVLESPSLLSDADVIILAPCGFSLERTHAELGALELIKSAEWQALPAVRAGRVAVADGNLYFNRSSCCVLETAEITAEIVHPALTGLFGHHGKRWVRLVDELAAFCEREGASPPTKRCDIAPTVQRDDSVAALPPSAKAQKTAVHADEPPSTRHVRDQLAALLAADFTRAFALNSAANQARLGDAATFERVVKGSASFRVLLDHATHVDVGTADGTNQASAAIRVGAQPAEPADPPVAFVFDLRHDPASGKWETDGVRIEC